MAVEGSSDGKKEGRRGLVDLDLGAQVRDCVCECEL